MSKERHNNGSRSGSGHTLPHFSNMPAAPVPNSGHYPSAASSDDRGTNAAPSDTSSGESPFKPPTLFSSNPTSNFWSPNLSNLNRSPSVPPTSSLFPSSNSPYLPFNHAHPMSTFDATNPFSYLSNPYFASASEPWLSALRESLMRQHSLSSMDSSPLSGMASPYYPWPSMQNPFLASAGLGPLMSSPSIGFTPPNPPSKPEIRIHEDAGTVPLDHPSRIGSVPPLFFRHAFHGSGLSSPNIMSPLVAGNCHTPSPFYSPGSFSSLSPLSIDRPPTYIDELDVSAPPTNPHAVKSSHSASTLKSSDNGRLNPVICNLASSSLMATPSPPAAHKNLNSSPTSQLSMGSASKAQDLTKSKGPFEKVTVSGVPEPVKKNSVKVKPIRKLDAESAFSASLSSNTFNVADNSMVVPSTSKSVVKTSSLMPVDKIQRSPKKERTTPVCDKKSALSPASLPTSNSLESTTSIVDNGVTIHSHLNSTPRTGSYLTELSSKHLPKSISSDESRKRKYETPTSSHAHHLTKRAISGLGKGPSKSSTTIPVGIAIAQQRSPPVRNNPVMTTNDSSQQLASHQSASSGGKASPGHLKSPYSPGISTFSFASPPTSAPSTSMGINMNMSIGSSNPQIVLYDQNRTAKYLLIPSSGISTLPCTPCSASSITVVASTGAMSPLVTTASIPNCSTSQAPFVTIAHSSSTATSHNVKKMGATLSVGYRSQGTSPLAPYQSDSDTSDGNKRDGTEISKEEEIRATSTTPRPELSSMAIQVDMDRDDDSDLQSQCETGRNASSLGRFSRATDSELDDYYAATDSPRLQICDSNESRPNSSMETKPITYSNSSINTKSPLPVPVLQISNEGDKVLNFIESQGLDSLVDTMEQELASEQSNSDSRSNHTLSSSHSDVFIGPTAGLNLLSAIAEQRSQEEQESALKRRYSADSFPSLYQDAIQSLPPINSNSTAQMEPSGAKQEILMPVKKRKRAESCFASLSKLDQNENIDPDNSELDACCPRPLTPVPEDAATDFPSRRTPTPRKIDRRKRAYRLKKAQMHGEDGTPSASENQKSADNAVCSRTDSRASAISQLSASSEQLLQESDSISASGRIDNSICVTRVTRAHLSDNKNMRVIIQDEDDGMLYAGTLSPVEPPDVYAVLLDGERAHRPHILTEEEVLTRVMRETKIASVDEIPPGTRVCCYYSNQYRCLYSGNISTKFTQRTQQMVDSMLVYIEFDDGDTGIIDLEDVRLLPSHFPRIEITRDPLVISPFTAKRRSSMKSSPVESSIFSLRAEKSIKSKPELKLTKHAKKADRHKDLEKERRRKAKKEDRRRLRATVTTESSDESVRSSLDSDPNAPNLPHVKIRISKEPIDKKTQGEKKMKTANNSPRKHLTPAHELPTRVKLSPSKIKTASAGSSETSPSTSQVSYFVPEHQLWKWSGSPIKRYGTKIRPKKEFFGEIVRGKDERVSVGDSAVFISSQRPHLPYIGRIEAMWRNARGAGRVKVRWFYHPQETKKPPPLKDVDGALFESNHFDENDIQTISHRCRVLSWEAYKKKIVRFASSSADSSTRNKSGPGCSEPKPANEGIYYLAGFYEPLPGKIECDSRIPLAK